MTPSFELLVPRAGVVVAIAGAVCDVRAGAGVATVLGSPSLESSFESSPRRSSFADDVSVTV
jgi:hypothetical protein